MINKIIKRIGTFRHGTPAEYKPKHYWDELSGPVVMSDALVEQQATIMKYLDKLHFTTVYELGVGEGRITEPILKTKDIIVYDGSDLAPERIVKVKQKLSKYKQFDVKYAQFQDIPIKRTYDLVLASEVLMHIKPEDLEQVMRKMVDISDKYVVNIDYYEEHEPEGLANHNFLHDYDHIYKKLGLEYEKIITNHKQAIFIGRITEIGKEDKNE